MIYICIPKEEIRKQRRILISVTRNMIHLFCCIRSSCDEVLVPLHNFMLQGYVLNGHRLHNIIYFKRLKNSKKINWLLRKINWFWDTTMIICARGLLDNERDRPQYFYPTWQTWLIQAGFQQLSNCQVIKVVLKGTEIGGVHQPVSFVVCDYR